MKYEIFHFNILKFLYIHKKYCYNNQINLLNIRPKTIPFTIASKWAGLHTSFTYPF